MNTILSSASLMLAMIAFLHAAWYPKIEKAIKYATEDKYADIKDKHDDLKQIQKTHAIPLAVASSGMALIILPVVVNIVSDCFSNLGSYSFFEAFQFYDPTAAAVLFIEVALVFFTWYLWSKVSQLAKTNKKFEKAKEKDITQ